VRDENAQALLTEVLDTNDDDAILQKIQTLQLMADFKYDHYQRFGPGQRFIESLALWLNQFDKPDRGEALRFVLERLIFISEREIVHLVETAYPDLIVHERIRMISEEQNIPMYKVAAIFVHPRFHELQLKSLYLGLSDGARTNELRRSADQAISNEQIWQAYELSEAKTQDMTIELRKALTEGGYKSKDRFNVVWLLDDFSGSGSTYIRFNSKTKVFQGKIKKIYDSLRNGELVDKDHHEVYLLLYIATRQAIDHIEYWSERFTSEKGYQPLRLRVLHIIEKDEALSSQWSTRFWGIVMNPKYYDPRSFDRHMEIGGGKDAKLGFANCALPLTLSHNTPNNSIYILWGPEDFEFSGLFPRVSRHRVVQDGI
jgi:hypothetical protein